MFRQCYNSYFYSNAYCQDCLDNYGYLHGNCCHYLSLLYHYTCHMIIVIIILILLFMYCYVYYIIFYYIYIYIYIKILYKQFLFFLVCQFFCKKCFIFLETFIEGILVSKVKTTFPWCTFHYDILDKFNFVFGAQSFLGPLIQILWFFVPS